MNARQLRYRSSSRVRLRYSRLAHNSASPLSVFAAAGDRRAVTRYLVRFTRSEQQELNEERQEERIASSTNWTPWARPAAASIVGGHDEREQTLNALLVEMDGFGSNSGVIVMAATNRPETLDPALLRPGRFDRHVLVDRPDIRGREEILKVHVKNVKLDESVDLQEGGRDHLRLRRGRPGQPGQRGGPAGRPRATRRPSPWTSSTRASSGSPPGLEKKQRIIHEDEKQRVAYHESGHALVAYSLPNTDPVHKVSIIPRGLAALGYTMQRPEGDRYLMTQSELESRIQVLLAGTIAEEMIFDDVSTGAQNDLERATEIARSMVMDFGMSRLGRVNYRESRRAAFFRRRRRRARVRTANRPPARSTKRSNGSSTRTWGRPATSWKSASRP